MTLPAAFYTIPVRTPFALTGSATDSDGDTVTYMWEQNDRGAAAGTALVSNTKTAGPLFRQFGVAAYVSPTDTQQYHSPGENAVTTDPSRTFPDLAQIASGNTNAKTGTCPAAPPAPPTGGATNAPADLVDCYSEFLPTQDWVGFTGDRTLHFRLTARDGHPGGGGVGSADVALVLTPAAGPFLVTLAGRADHRRGRHGADRHVGRGGHERRAGQRGTREDLALRRRRAALHVRPGRRRAEHRQRHRDDAERRHHQGPDQGRGGREHLLRPQRRRHHDQRRAGGVQRRTVGHGHRRVQRRALPDGDRDGER